MQQRTTEWIEKVDLNYHSRQYATPFRSTVLFCEWLEKLNCLNADSKLQIADIGTGQGANIYHMSNKFRHCTYLGLDINTDLIETGNNFFKEKKIHNCRLEYGDIYNLDAKHISNFDGVVSYQTLSWLPGYEAPLKAMMKLNPEWIALTSLFYDGEADCHIDVKNFIKDKNSIYNIYSLPRIKEFLSRHGYSDIQTTPFNIDVDLAKPADKGMGTYTETLQSGDKIQIAGPLLMPWYFILARKL